MSVLYVKDNQGNITQIRTIRGEKGIDGLGISAAEINENGELVLTYTDGNIVNLGKVVGSDGYTPVKGIDYWTEEEVTAIQEDNYTYITEELAKRGQLKQGFANSTIYIESIEDGIYINQYESATMVYSNLNEDGESVGNNIFLNFGDEVVVKTTGDDFYYSKTVKIYSLNIDNQDDSVRILTFENSDNGLYLIENEEYQYVAIPPITSDDEGKVLRVVDGRLQLVNMSSTETSSTLLSSDGYVLKDKNGLYLILREGE